MPASPAPQLIEAKTYDHVTAWGICRVEWYADGTGTSYEMRNGRLDRKNHWGPVERIIERLSRR